MSVEIVQSYSYLGMDAMICEVKNYQTEPHFTAYVRLPDGHPLHGLSYADEDFPGLSVHGGVTWTGPLDDLKPGWWVGIDFAHSCDRPGDWTPLKVRGELDKLVAQVREIGDEAA